MKKYDTAVIGGDKRTAYMALYLEEKGMSVVCYGLQETDAAMRTQNDEAMTLRDAVESAAVVIGGVPFLKNKRLWGGAGFKEEDGDAEAFAEALREGQLFFAGVIPDEFRKKCENKGVICHDFMKEETIAVYNAIATAEGAVAEAVRNRETNLHGSRALVLGYGRCGRVLCDKLKGLNVHVTVCSRNGQELAWAGAMGLKTLELPMLKEKLPGFEYVFNTVPALILREEELKRVGRETLIVDIASGIGGVDYAAAAAIGIRALHCLGLPGKCAAKASAGCLARFVSGKLEQL